MVSGYWRCSFTRRVTLITRCQSKGFKVHLWSHWRPYTTTNIWYKPCIICQCIHSSNHVLFSFFVDLNDRKCVYCLHAFCLVFGKFYRAHHDRISLCYNRKTHPFFSVTEGREVLYKSCLCIFYNCVEWVKFDFYFLGEVFIFYSSCGWSFLFQKSSMPPPPSLISNGAP